ncbi:MAG TPA: HAMP domain-containing histidine kinase [Candidatus Acutalibacter stercorigallinarum]|nr:HAMP domain-containing histidine kinase [Candidatus Acutalibacter stercorigallinarum]
MIFRLRRKFIWICTLSFLGVFAALFSGIFLITYLQTAASLDDLADIVSENDGRFPDFQPPGPQEDPRPAERDPEAPFTTRFFTVTFPDTGEAAANVNSIASVSQEEAEDLARQALDENRERGWVGEYRFKVWESEKGTAVVCVSGALMLDADRAFLMAACLVFGAGSLAALLLVVVFSKGAVRPVAESHQRQRQFVTDASHELKTPLTLLQTNLDILEGDVGPNPWLSDMKEETATLTDLVCQLVDLARLDEEAPLQAEAFDLAQAVWDTASAFSPVTERQGKQLVMEGPSSLWWKGDEAALRRLVSILLDNAVKYCDPGGTIWVGLSGRRRPVLTVDNSCQHVNELPLPRLFDRFYRGDSARTYGSGFGVGLSIAKGIAQRQGGDITALGLEGDKICFRVKL